MTKNKPIKSSSAETKTTFHQDANQEDRKDMPLSSLMPGQLAKVLRIDGDRQARLRFMEMGFIRGETVFVERVAPMGDPIEYQIKGYHLSLRRADAERILVQPLISNPDD